MISNVLKNKIRAYYNERLEYALINRLSVSGRKPFVLEFNNRKSSIGLCDYSKETIFISEFHGQYASWEGLKNTINHELAHWAAPRGSKHGPAWKAMAVKFGIEPNRCGSHTEFEYPFLIMFEDEIVSKHYELLDDISSRWILRRKRETEGKLYMKLNPNMIDNSIYGV